jgi:hypothetical protein
MNNSLDTELIDLMDLLENTLSKTFIDKWMPKYGERIIRLFQVKILDSLKKQKPLKIESIFKFLSVDSGFNEDLVKDFLTDVEIELYYPIVIGKLA